MCVVGFLRIVTAGGILYRRYNVSDNRNRIVSENVLQMTYNTECSSKEFKQMTCRLLMNGKSNRCDVRFYKNNRLLCVTEICFNTKPCC